MKKVLLFSLLFIFGCSKSPSTLPTIDSSGQTQSVSSLSLENKNTISQINSKLSQLERRYISKLSSIDRRQALNKLDEVYDLLFKLRNGKDFIKKPMNSENFNSFYQRVKNASFKSEKNEIIELASRDNYFSINQILTMFSLFNFDSEKLDVLRLMYPKSVDRGNSFKILDSFTFSSSKREAKVIIERNQVNDEPNQIIKKAISQDLFNIFYSEIQKSTFDLDKLELIKVSVKSNYFSISQILKTFELFRFDDEKFEVLKVMYPKSIQREESFKLLDSFSFNSSKEKVKSLIESAS